LAKQFREFCQNAKMPKRTQRGENEIKQRRMTKKAAWSRFSLAVARFKHELSKNWNRGILVSVLLLCGLRGGRRPPGNEKPGAVSRPGVDTVLSDIVLYSNPVSESTVFWPTWLTSSAPIS
jgi:hypothetical protein